MIKSTMVAGEPFEVAFNVTFNGLPSDIGGYAAELELRKTTTSGEVIESWADGDDEITRNNANGSIILLLPALKTNAYDFTVAYIDLLLLETDGGGGRRSATLQVELIRGVTR